MVESFRLTNAKICYCGHCYTSDRGWAAIQAIVSMAWEPNCQFRLLFSWSDNVTIDRERAVAGREPNGTRPAEEQHPLRTGPSRWKWYCPQGPRWRQDVGKHWQQSLQKQNEKESSIKITTTITWCDLTMWPVWRSHFCKKFSATGEPSLCSCGALFTWNHILHLCRTTFPFSFIVAGTAEKEGREPVMARKSNIPWYVF